MRPLSHAIQGMFCISQLIAKLQTAVLRGQASRTNQVNRELSGVNTFVWSALEDLADSMGRFNSNAVRHLRGLWLDKSSLPTETREELRQRPITRGRVPADRNSVYTAPLIGGFIPDLYVPHRRGGVRAQQYQGVPFISHKLDPPWESLRLRDLRQSARRGRIPTSHLRELPHRFQTRVALANQPPSYQVTSAAQDPIPWPIGTGINHSYYVSFWLDL